MNLSPEIVLACLEKRAAWVMQARPNQLPPQCEWQNWFLCAGRGFGKSRTISEDAWFWGFEHPDTRIAVIAPTSGDVRDTIYEGVSGLLNCVPECLIADYKSSLSELSLKNNTIIKGFSAERPDRLRGPQHHRVYADELAAWALADETWDMMSFGLRLGDNPQVVIASTPRPIDLVRRLYEDPNTFVTHGTTYENQKNLSKQFYNAIKVYEGTTIGRQELDGELLSLEEQGIFKRSWFKLWPRKKQLPVFHFLIQSYDTAFTDKTTNDPTGSITLGVFKLDDVPQPQVMLLDCWTEHLKYPDLKARVVEESKFLYGGSDKPVDLILIENKGSGQDIINDLRFSTSLPLFAYNPLRADKASRAHAISYIPCNGQFWIPESEINKGKPRDWVEPYLHQMCAFPHTKHDEYLDCTSQALALIRDQGWLLTPDEDEGKYIDKEEKPWFNGNRRGNPYMV